MHVDVMRAGGVGGGDRFGSGSGRCEAGLCLTVTVLSGAQSSQMGRHVVEQAAAWRESERAKEKMKRQQGLLGRRFFKLT